MIVQGGTAPSPPDIGHQARGLDVDLLAVSTEIEEPAGRVLASLIRITVVSRRGAQARLHGKGTAVTGRS
ncbi:hypothetical protein ABNQ39_27345 [Azospirillum sp. A26]|uniref:hypothetical protein n=1 Tax=Azospirillum sp. A26 TaxID=3160607 RepID=UPI0036714B38